MDLLRFLFRDISQHTMDKLEDSLESGKRILKSDGSFTQKLVRLFIIPMVEYLIKLEILLFALMVHTQYIKQNGG
jgi:hypothetical protein